MQETSGVPGKHEQAILNGQIGGSIVETLIGGVDSNDDLLAATAVTVQQLQRVVIIDYQVGNLSASDLVEHLQNVEQIGVVVHAHSSGWSIWLLHHLSGMGHSRYYLLIDESLPSRVVDLLKVEPLLSSHLLTLAVFLLEDILFLFFTLGALPP
jgi:hypothetical protein